MIYDDNKNIYSETPQENSREFNELKAAVIALEGEVSEVKTDVDGLKSEIETADLNATSATVTSISSTNIITENLTSTSKIEANEIDVTETITANEVSAESATINGDLTVTGTINGTLQEFNTEAITSDVITVNDRIETVDELISGQLDITGTANINEVSSNKLYVGTKIKINNDADGNVEFGEGFNYNNETKTTGVAKMTAWEIEANKIKTAVSTDLKDVTADEITTETLTLKPTGSAKISTIIATEKYINIAAHSTGDDEFIEVEPFNGIMNLKLVKGADNILSISIAEVTTNNGQVVANIKYSADTRDYLKTVELSAEGKLYFRTFGDGKLYYTLNSIDTTEIAPATYYATRPTAVILSKVDILENVGSFTIQSYSTIQADPESEIENVNETGNIPVGIIFKIDAEHASEITELGGTWAECDENGELI